MKPTNESQQSKSHSETLKRLESFSNFIFEGQTDWGKQGRRKDLASAIGGRKVGGLFAGK